MSKKFSIGFASILLFGAYLFMQCSGEQKSAANAPEWKEIQQQRAQKDSLFKFSQWTPIPPGELVHFRGLNYYPIDLAYRFEGPIVKYNPMERDTIMGTGGDLRPALKYGYFQFNFQGKTYQLQVYKILDENPAHDKFLFLGFTDETNGTETYGGGRYIDIVENEQNHYIVDFNLAYNPYCAYNPKYSCAVPPAENHLPFPVRAGEKLFKQHK